MPKTSQELLLAHASVLLGCSWSFLACSWLPLAMLARMPKVSQELFLDTPGCSWVAPGASWQLLAAFSHVGPNPARSFSWPLLGALGLLLEFSWASNALRPVCQHAAKLLPMCAELGQECNGGYGGKAQGFS